MQRKVYPQHHPDAPSIARLNQCAGFPQQASYYSIRYQRH